MTPFSEIYTRFLSQTSSYELVSLDEEELQEEFLPWLLSAIGYFTNCRKDLFKILDKDIEAFDETLDDMEIDILAKHMVHTYIGTYAITEENIAQVLNSRDYRSYSPANQLKVLLETQSKVKSDADLLMSRYSYNVHIMRENEKKKKR